MQFYSAYIYEANSSLQLKSETIIVIYYVLPSSGHVLALLLELWLPRYEGLLHFAWIVRWTNTSGNSNRNKPPRSNRTLPSFSTMLLWSRNIFKLLLDHSTSWEIVIFCFKIFTRSMPYQRRSYSQCQPSNIVMSNAKTPSYTIQWRENAANCSDNCEMRLLLVIFYTAIVKINKKCQSATSFSINNVAIDTLSLTYPFYNAIRAQSFDFQWPTLSKSLHNSLSTTQKMDSTTPKATISQPKDQIQTCNAFQTAVCCCPNLYQQMQCLVSSNNTQTLHLSHQNLVSVKIVPSTFIDNKSAIPCQFHLQLL